ncbi:hypothetical protein SAMN05192576_0949 [Nocardioides szechwanensis]|uniref:Uncharacterized protein n=1 Tax=Nocardioides szechwanensis TaxID=1005944 RepID=A0A1G9W502_9ACTN|nr:hypothetical protein SAMN05192576_0949 [Nocardioides szechwanensis]
MAFQVPEHECPVAHGGGGMSASFVDLADAFGHLLGLALSPEDEEGIQVDAMYDTLEAVNAQFSGIGVLTLTVAFAQRHALLVGQLDRAIKECTVVPLSAEAIRHMMAQVEDALREGE